MRRLLCFLQDLNLGEHPGVSDSWMDIVASQGSSLLSVDLSGSDVTDSGLIYLKDCKNLQELNFNYCDQISDKGLEYIKSKKIFSYYFFPHSSSGFILWDCQFLRSPWFFHFNVISTCLFILLVVVLFKVVSSIIHLLKFHCLILVLSNGVIASC